MSFDDYLKGFREGMSLNHNEPRTFSFMGYTMDLLIELIRKDEEEKFYSGAQWTEQDIKNMERNKMATEVNRKFEYCGYDKESSDRDFLGFIYARLNQVFGEKSNTTYMQRLEKLIDNMPGKIRIGCDCSAADKCPQGRMGSQIRCSIWKDNQK